MLDVENLAKCALVNAPMSGFENPANYALLNAPMLDVQNLANYALVNAPMPVSLKSGKLRVAQRTHMLCCKPSKLRVS